MELPDIRIARKPYRESTVPTPPDRVLRVLAGDLNLSAAAAAAVLADVHLYHRVLGFRAAGAL